MYQFFAIVEEPDGNRMVRRVPLERNLQEKLSAELLEQSSELVPHGVDMIQYEPGYTPGDDEVFVLKSYDVPPYLVEALERSDALPLISDTDLEEGRVKSLFGIKLAIWAGQPQVLFQNFNSGQVLRREKSLFLYGDTFQKSERIGLSFGTKVSAALMGGNLYFRSEHMVRRYLELDYIFTAATDEEVDDFLASTAFSPISRERFLESADRWVRLKTSSILSRKILQQVTATAQEFSFEVQTLEWDGQVRIVVPEEKQALKRLLRLLDEDLLQSRLTEARYQVNSKRRLPLNE